MSAPQMTGAARTGVTGLHPMRRRDDAPPELLSLLPGERSAREAGGAQDDWRAVVTEAGRPA
ncbi:hypothetical protein [Streptomyces fulvorobeus]|uniref:Uncharacterized protein n=1 Tax=Streptomyces fulvorobeus TaxID=284028 RepID=A0A7J0CDQ6_9ACTN|nr:hypothetical protein [Streptomyces fulvorobeus]NYE44140.1 hypothetical protein [Streptomyces fulvorobeus]GFN00652.1 hypothetical protein Sfulv_54620 [Streptomyces fulvorobeus]